MNQKNKISSLILCLFAFTICVPCAFSEAPKSERKATPAPKKVETAQRGVIIAPPILKDTGYSGHCYYTEEEHRQVRIEAAKLGITMGEVLRNICYGAYPDGFFKLPK